MQEPVAEWYTDRTRYTMGVGDCPMKRYLAFHAGEYGYGWSRKGTAIPLATGTYVHQALAEILLLAKDGKSDFRSVILKAVANYHSEIAARGFDGVDSLDAAIIVNEQGTLIEGLAWAWVRIMLPRILEEFEIVAVEVEERFSVATHMTKVVQMSRPDIILRRKADGKLGVHDFKTTANVTDAMVKEYQHSVQMMVGTVGAALRLGEPIDHYYIHALTKGGRGEFTKGSGFRQQYSHLCYAKIYPPRPPLQNDVTWDFKGYWKDKTPLWEVDFPQKPLEMSPVEFWVSKLPEEILFEVFTLIGPYLVVPEMVDQWMNSMPHEELRWIERLWKLHEIEEKEGWASETFQAELSRQVPRSYRCYDYGSRCSYWDLCFHQPGWEDPVGSGRFTHRRPHHEPELLQLKARGIPVPLAAGEEE